MNKLEKELEVLIEFISKNHEVISDEIKESTINRIYELEAWFDHIREVYVDNI